MARLVLVPVILFCFFFVENLTHSCNICLQRVGLCVCLRLQPIFDNSINFALWAQGKAKQCNLNSNNGNKLQQQKQQ